jgi:DNA-directed RNA polymerase subunit RPC12/RpoP
MADVLMREVVCRNCSHRTRLPVPTLEPVLWLQATFSQDGTYINYACPACGKLTSSSMESAAKISRDVDLKKFPDDLTVYIVFLKCAGTSCESPVIVLAPVKKEVRDVELMAHIHATWNTDNAICAKGYPPMYPYEGRIWKQLEADPTLGRSGVP